MVRAILDGRKTMTRRIVKPQPEMIPKESLLKYQPEGSFWWPAHKARTMVDISEAKSLCPYGQVRDHLWVRETFSMNHSTHYATRQGNAPSGILYRASWDKDTDYYDRPFDGDRKWRPSIFMPRAYSRITLEITDIRVERLKDVSDEDAMREGIHALGQGIGEMSAREVFSKLWDTINGKRASWESNPWVWVITFKKI